MSLVFFEIFTIFKNATLFIIINLNPYLRFLTELQVLRNRFLELSKTYLYQIFDYIYSIFIRASECSLLWINLLDL